MMNSNKTLIAIKGVPMALAESLTSISQKYGYPSRNQFMLSQLELICQNEGLNIYHNLLASDLEEIKKIQSAVQEKIFEIELVDLEIKKHQQLIENLSLRWLGFMEEVQAIYQKGEAYEKE